MPVISKISVQQKNKGRFNIFFKKTDEEEFGFGVSEDILIQYNLHKGMELSEEDIKQLKNKDELHKSYTRAIHYLSYRMRSEKEMYDYLIDKEVTEEDARDVINRLYKENLLDDEAFAKSYVQSKIATSSKGPVVLKQELSKKGVAEDYRLSALEQYSFEDQYEKALKFGMKKVNDTSKKAFQQKLQTAKQSMMQKGFTQDVIQEVAARLAEEKEDSSERTALELQGEKAIRKYEKKAEGFELKQKVMASLYRKGFSGDLIREFLEEKGY
ncbi:recombination regulator RecX [Salimicrobium salexigens]|uniref:Regulatory protein RecX n=1 Tax=Salimicrobium salexigens TaxID=908941 RepID=A0ABY1KU33_9BACI|nr:recombination regulator RecX [Salimicrobium salexigens]SIS78348.1 regulatory protein [Salimicrobium salexigens]